ncbi:MAG: 4-hydroxy-3-methylbut-2-enyl diphosphate reductase [Thermotogales bacterium 46_20]|nr:MAG: 4-hydroxy-3-methylbut-2-enyl diphosphate reductase [Thermotogales bacterium 46_20]
MRVIVSEKIGFCQGVENAVRGTCEALKTYESVQVSGQIVHNHLICSELVEMGLKVHPDNVLPQPLTEDSVALIRAHGIDLESENELKKRFPRVLDFTCPIVSSVFQLAERLDRQGYIVVVLGKKQHPEIRALVSRINRHFLVEDLKDLDQVIGELKKDEKKVALISQTTTDTEKFGQTQAFLEKELGKRIKVFDTICRFTKERESAARHLAHEADLVIVVGAPNSSNTMKLVNIVKNAGTCAILVEDSQDLSNLTLPETVGLISGTSASTEQVQKILDNIEKVARR